MNFQESMRKEMKLPKRMIYEEHKDYYDNGMVKLQSRIEDEFWYSDYQTVMELITYNDFNSLSDFINAARREIHSYRKVPYQMEFAIHMWCVLHWERKKRI